MAKSQSLVEKLFYNGHRSYSRTSGNVAYLDGTGLDRPATMPRPQRLILAVFVVIAIVIGIFIIKDTVISSLQATVLAKQTIEANMERPASIESIPRVQTLINLNDSEIVSTVEAAGNQIYNASDVSSSGNLVLYRIPNDVAVADAAGFYRRGINTLTASEATLLLNGAWSLIVDRIGTTSIVVRYADFSTGDPAVAVQNALAKEGFDVASVTDSGIDDSDNTFTAGTLTVDGTPCIWKISALPFDDMYSINGMPEDACYVGIRVTKTVETSEDIDEEDEDELYW